MPQIFKEIGDVEKEFLVLQTCLQGKMIVGYSAAPSVAEKLEDGLPHLAEAIQSCNAGRVGRFGKVVWIEWPEWSVAFIIHFKIAGTFVMNNKSVRYSSDNLGDVEVYDDPYKEWDASSCLITFETLDGTIIGFEDAGEFTVFQIVTQFSPSKIGQYVNKRYPACLDITLLTHPAEQQFFRALRRTKMHIRNFFSHQVMFFGLSSWVIDEILYQARIHPLQPANSLSQQEMLNLYAATEHVARYTVQVCGNRKAYPTTWLAPHIWSAQRIRFNTVYSPDGYEVAGLKNQNTRTTYYVPQLQRLRTVPRQAAKN